jgi:hypothetical protein
MDLEDSSCDLNFFLRVKYDMRLQNKLNVQ